MYYSVQSTMCLLLCSAEHTLARYSSERHRARRLRQTQDVLSWHVHEYYERLHSGHLGSGHPGIMIIVIVKLFNFPLPLRTPLLFHAISLAHEISYVDTRARSHPSNPSPSLAVPSFFIQQTLSIYNVIIKCAPPPSALTALTLAHAHPTTHLTRFTHSLAH